MSKPHGRNKIEIAQQTIKFFENILHASIDGIVIIDPTHNIIAVNNAFCSFFGHQRHEVIETNLFFWLEQLDIDGIKRWTEMESRVYREGSCHSVEFIVTTPKRVKYLSVSASLMGKVGTEETGTIISIWRDITEQKRAKVLIERVRLTEFVKDVGIAFTQGNTLREILHRCASAIVNNLGAALVRIWTLNEKEGSLELQVSAGLYTHTGGPHRRIPVGKFTIGLIARKRKPYMTNSIITDSQIGDKEWAIREKMIAFAGYPLIVEDRLVGVVAMFARKPLTEFTVKALASAADIIALNITNKRTEEALRMSEERFRLLLNSTEEAIYGIDTCGNCTFANSASLRMLGYRDISSLAGKNMHATIHHTKGNGRPYPAEECPIYLSFKYGKSSHRDNEVFWRAEGTCFPVEYWSHPMYHHNEIIGSVITFIDISRRKQAEAEKARLSAILEETSDFVGIVDPQGCSLYMNRAGRHMLGISAEENITGMDIIKAYPEWASRIILNKGIPHAICNGTWTGETAFLRRDGREIPISQIILSHKSPEGSLEFISTVARDITEHKRAEEKIKHIAFHDALTNLPNRILFYDRLNLAISHAHRTKEMLAVIFLDLDRFKIVNDTLGHTIGDQLLRKVAKRLKKCVREDDTIARLSGDEFSFLLSGITRAEHINHIAQKILTALKQPCIVGGHKLYITASIGIAFYPDDGKNVETLLKNADIAMYHAKEQGKNNYQLYNPHMHARSLEKIELENAIRHALDYHEFIVYYQPQINIHVRQIIGMEALVRWKHPNRGLIAPKAFLPLAEETRLIVSLDKFVLSAACAQIKAWLNADFQPGCVSVNLSAHTFQQQDLVEMITLVLQQNSLDPNFLGLEITESIAMLNMEAAIHQLTKLRRLGIQIAIDDFGVGFSSLNYLKQFPVDKIKICSDFVQGITTSQKDAVIVESIVGLAKGLKFNVIAEGVETEKQLAFLRQRECNEIQGNFFCSPLPADMFEKDPYRNIFDRS